jgi:hypothetical protein
MICFAQIDRNSSACVGACRAIDPAKSESQNKISAPASMLRTLLASGPVPSTWTGLLQNRKTVSLSRMRLAFVIKGLANFYAHRNRRCRKS